MKNKPTRHETTNKAGWAAALLPLLLILGAPAHAGLIQIDFTATISNDGGTTTDDIVGQFTLDDSVFWGVGVGGVDGAVDSGSALLFGTTETADTASAFTFVAAALGSGYGVLTVIADYGTGFFSLELAADSFFSTANVFDDLVPDLTLADLRAYNAAEAIGTTRFINLVGYTDQWEGALTSFSVTLVSEPATLWLLMMFVPGFIVWRRRTA